MNSSTAIPAPRSTPVARIAAASCSGSSARCVPDAPAASRGLRITGNPTAATNSSTSATDEAPVEAAHATPAARSTSFIAGLSRHRKAVRDDVPGIVHASRT